MGFRFDPGPLPFITIRDAKWANRLAELPMALRIHGEHGCQMPRQIGTVVRVEPYDGRRPMFYLDGQALVSVWIIKPYPCQGAHAWDNEWGMCAHCGEPITEVLQ